MIAGKTFWLIGASEGLGRALAIKLHKKGANLLLSARNADRLQELSGSIVGSSIIPVDVCDQDSVNEAVSKLSSTELDGVIYSVGLYEPMRAENWDAEFSNKMADANFNGALRVLGHVVPDMVAKNKGHIVLIGSLGGITGLPGAIGYGASKSALMHLAENINADLWKTDVKVQIMNPGFIKTRLTDKNSFSMPFLMTPEEAAIRIVKAMERGRFRTDFPFMFSLVFRLGKLLPRKWFYRLFD